MQIYYPLKRNQEGEKITVLRNKNKYLLLYTTLEALKNYLQRSNNNSFHYYTIIDDSLIKIDKDRYNKDGDVSVELPISFKVGKCYPLKIDNYTPNVTNVINHNVTWTPYF